MIRLAALVFAMAVYGDAGAQVSGAQQSGVHVIEQAVARFCQAVKDMAVTASTPGGLAALPADWDTLPAYSPLRSPTGGYTGWTCSRGQSNGRDQVECSRTYVRAPDSEGPPIGKWPLGPCLAEAGWTVAVTGRGEEETFHRFTRAESPIEITGIWTPINIVTRTERLIISAPMKR